MRIVATVGERLIFVALLAGSLILLPGCGGGGGGGTPAPTPTPTPTPPAAPTGVSAVAGSGQNTISWSVASGATSHNLYWQTTPGVTRSTGTRIANVTSAHTHAGLSAGTTYYYVVTAVNSVGESSESTQVSSRVSWNSRTPLAVGQGNMSSAVASGILYIAGGVEHNVGPTSALRAYDPASDTWTTRAPMPTSRAYAGAGVINGRIYLAGGCAGSDCRIGTTNILEIYDPATNSWSTGAPMPTARSGMAAGVIGGKLYLAGGSIACPPCSFQSTVQVYDPATNTWSTVQPLQSGRNQPGGAVIDGLFYVFGGSQPVGSQATATYLSSVEVYNPVTNTWTARATMPTPRHGAAVEVIDGIVYVLGGNTSGGGVVSTLEAYDPVLNTWSTRPSMPTPRSNLGSGVLNGRLYAVGGTDGSFNISPVEVFAP